MFTRPKVTKPETETLYLQDPDETETLNPQDQDETETFNLQDRDETKHSKKRLETETFKTETTPLPYTFPTGFYCQTSCD